MRLAILASIGLLLAAFPALAQEVPGVHKQDLQGILYPAGHQTLMIRTSIDPRATMPAHTHPGIEAGYVLHGSAVVRIAGHPDRTVGEGDSFIVPPRMVHSVTNTGEAPLVILTTYVVKAGAPLIRLVRSVPIRE